jgi:DNA-binding response OmpR family regulator
MIGVPNSTQLTPNAGRILVVENDSWIREVVVGLLEESGFEVACAYDAPTAFAAFGSGMRPFGTAIVDLRLPGSVGGEELARTLHSKGLRIILVSADPEQCEPTGGRGPPTVSLAKPFGCGQLLDCVAEGALLRLRPVRRRPKAVATDDWDLVRAAKHMIDIYGARAAWVAEDRAENASELEVIRRWHAIASKIRALQA